MIGNIYDVIFIDEVQDFRSSELNLVRRLAKRINAAGDKRQRIWGHREGIPAVSAMVSKIVNLEEHYRIGTKICDFADQILPPKLGDPPLSEGCNYPEEKRPSSIIISGFEDLDTELQTCIRNIRQQRRYISDEPIGVLCISNRLRDAFWERISSDDELSGISMVQRSENYQPFGSESMVRVMTVASAKGSEFRAVHLLGGEDYHSNRRELAFTAVTRAKTEVNIYHVRPLSGHMVPPIHDLPSIDSIF